MYDSLNMHSLESSLIDIMRAEQDPMKGRVAFPFLSALQGQREVMVLTSRATHTSITLSCVLFFHVDLNTSATSFMTFT